MSDTFRFPGVPDDDPLGDIDIPSPLTPKVSTYSSATVAVENGEVNAFTVHSNRMRSTRALTDLGLGTAADLDSRTLDLLAAALDLTSSLKVRDALQRFVTSACQLTGAAWGTIAVHNQNNPFGPMVNAGVPTASPVQLAYESVQGPNQLNPQQAGTLIDSGAIIRNDLSVASAFTGAIEGEGPGSLLTVPLQVHSQIFGQIYLCDKPGGFVTSDAATVSMLARAAAVAIDNARLYRVANERTQWMSVSQELTSTLLSGADEEDALGLITKRVREVARADTSALILPGIGDSWVCELADGLWANELIGTVFPPDGRAMNCLHTRCGLLVPSLREEKVLRVEELSRFGPALYAPMISHSQGIGVILLLRAPGRGEFTEQDLEIAQLVASQASMAFELASAQHAEEMANLLDERARIGRDLHDLAIQQLFATGMRITSARKRLASGEQLEPDEILAALDGALGAIDESVAQIRSIVRSLRDRDEEVGVVERLRRESSLARNSLGYAPSLIITVDGKSLSNCCRDEEDNLISIIDAAVDDDLADDLVAVTREALANVARHAKASSVRVQIDFTGLDLTNASCQHTPSQVEIQVDDDGVGLDPTSTRSSGTANMSQRALRRGGSFSLGPSPRDDAAQAAQAGQDTHRGTRLIWQAPLENSVS